MTRTGVRPRSSRSAARMAADWAASRDPDRSGVPPKVATTVSWMPRTPIMGLGR